jgi:hypothetical protein
MSAPHHIDVGRSGIYPNIFYIIEYYPVGVKLLLVYEKLVDFDSIHYNEYTKL